MRIAAATTLVLVLGAGSACGGGGSAVSHEQYLYVQKCAGCHGTEGRSVGGIPPSLAGQSKDYILQALKDFKEGKRPGTTIMHQHAKGYTDQQLELIAANLPYISTQQRQTLSREVLHDPDVALFAGPRGDELLRELIAKGPSRLRPGGVLALEIGIGQSEMLVAAMSEKNYRDIWTESDYSGVTRFLFARYG